MNPRQLMKGFALLWIFSVMIFILQERQQDTNPRLTYENYPQTHSGGNENSKHYNGIYRIYGESVETNHLWPNENRRHDDRILEQIKHIPRHLKSQQGTPEDVKTIYIPQALPHGTLPGRSNFEQCPVSMCSLTSDRQYKDTAHARLLQNEKYDSPSSHLVKPQRQVWILWILESPRYTLGKHYNNLNGLVNWTASYRSDSTFVTPYEKYIQFQNSSGILPEGSKGNYAEGKTEKVAWFVSNCKSHNKRLEYARELSKFIQVDIYGACGNKWCSHQDSSKCYKMLQKKYKFYLSFENSNCEYYITEKLFRNALLNHVVPIVMGARIEDYIAAAPPNSFIHVESFSNPQELAKYLLHLDQNDYLYNQYFRWKNTGEFINAKFWCRLCSMLHDVGHDGKIMWYEDIEQWWRNRGSCTVDRWDNPDHVITNWKMMQYVDLVIVNALKRLLLIVLYLVILFTCFCIYKSFCIHWKDTNVV